MKMPHKSVPPLLVPGLFALGLAASLAGAAATPPDGLTPVSLRASNTDNTVRFDFGKTSLLDEAQIVHTFRLRNDGTTPLTLESLVPSCHCTTALVEPDGALPTLAPGQQASVRVSIMAEPYLTGTLTKSVAVFAQGISEPVATLEIDVVLQPSVTLTPDSLDFGTVAAGQPRSTTVTAALDSRLLSPGQTPMLVASDPDLQITALPAGIPPAGPPSGFRSFAFRVTLVGDAALGPVRDLLHFAPSTGGTAALSLADGPSLPVVGEVAGAATAEPASLAFGVVRRGRPAVRPVQLAARAPGLWPSAKIAADSPWVTARLSPSPAARRTLDVTLDPAAPAGSLQAQITVTLANGQRLRIPVTAYVSTSPQ